MPDQKTVYMSDDGGGVILFKFVADTAGDLSSGTLYAAAVTQDTLPMDAAEAGFDISWVELASASNADIESWVDEYDDVTTADYVDGDNSYITDQQINDWAEAKLNQDLDELTELHKNCEAMPEAAEYAEEMKKAKAETIQKKKKVFHLKTMFGRKIYRKEIIELN